MNGYCAVHWACVKNHVKMLTPNLKFYFFRVALSMTSLFDWALALPSATGMPVAFLPGLTLMTLVASKNDMNALRSPC